MRLILSLVMAVSLVACATAKTDGPVDETDPNWEGPPPEAFGTLDENDIADVCELLDGHYMCVECSCSGFGNAVGQGRVQINGINVEGGEVNAEHDIVEDDAGWRLAKDL